MSTMRRRYRASLSKWQRVERVVLPTAAVVLAGVCVWIGDIAPEIMFVMSTLLLIIGDVVNQILFAIEHQNECDYPGCLARRGHGGLHVLADRPWR